MSLINSVTDDEGGLALGVDVTSFIAAVSRGFVRDAWNVDPGLTDGYATRKGYGHLLSAVWTGRKITAGIQYGTPTVSLREVLFGTTGVTGTIGYVTGGGVTNILSGLSATARPAFVQLNTLLAFFNGSDAPVIYDGTSTRQMGVTRPISAPTLTSQNNGGNLVVQASYLLAYTYYNSTTKAESSPSDLLTVVLTGAHQQITAGVTAGSSTTADTIRVYRSFANGQALYLDQELAISATSFTTSQLDAGLTTQMEADNSRVTDFAPAISTIQAQYPAMAQNRLFVKTDRNTVRHSKIGQSGPMLESFEVSALVGTKGKHGDTDDIVGIGVVGGEPATTPIVLKQRSFGRLDPVGIPAGVGAVDTVRYTYTELSPTVGAVSHEAAVTVYGELVWLGHDNIYATDGTGVRPVGDRVQAFLATAGWLPTQAAALSAVNDVRNKKVIFSVYQTELSTIPNFQLVGDYRQYPNFRWTFYRPGENSVTAPGLAPGCFYTVTSSADGGTDVRMGSFATAGQVFTLGASDDDDGSAIEHYVQTRPYTFGSEANEKLAKYLYLAAQGNGASYSLSISGIADLSGVEDAVESFDLAGTGARWDISKWDVDTWASSPTIVLHYDMHQKVRYQQFVFRHIGVGEPITLFPWKAAASIFKLFGGN